MRADRLVAIVLLLQARGQMTAPALAEELEVSERTVRRDLDALLAAGVPLYSQRGRGGGWALLDGHRLNLSGLTAEEAEALLLVAGPQALSGLGMEAGVRSALRKLLAALPAPIRERASAASSTVHVDPFGWGRAAEELPQLAALRTAVVAGTQVDLDYARPGHGVVQRRVHPYGLVTKGGVWYLLAGATPSPDRRAAPGPEVRTYRVARVEAIHPTAEPVLLPKDFDLARAWAAAQSSYAARIRLVEVELVTDRVTARLLESLLGPMTDLGDPVRGPADGGRRPPGGPPDPVRLLARFASSEMAAVELARFGSRLEVLRPAEVRAALGRIGAELASCYPPPEPEPTDGGSGVTGG